jgi:hypothetical protein
VNLIGGVHCYSQGPEPVVVDALWKEPDGAGEIMAELRAENDDLYGFEKMLETVEKTSQNIHRIGRSHDSQPSPFFMLLETASEWIPKKKEEYANQIR